MIDMKKALIPAVIIGGAIGVGVVLYGASQGWFSSKPGNGDKKAVAPPPRKNGSQAHQKPEELITTRGLERLKSMRKAKAAELATALEEWGRQTGIERRISWEAVRKGAGPKEESETRIRACQLAAALSRKPEDRPVPPPVDAKAVAPLVSCLKSGNPGLISASVKALCTMNLTYPDLKIKAAMLPEVKRLLASENATVALAALPAVPFLKEVSLAPEVVAAWEKHAGAPDFTDKCCPVLRTLLQVHLNGTLRKEHPDWSRPRCAKEAKAKAYKLYEELGREPAKWKAYWTRVLGTGEPKPRP